MALKNKGIYKLGFPFVTIVSDLIFAEYAVDLTLVFPLKHGTYGYDLLS